MTVHFDSPVKEGSDVEMECRYSHSGSNRFTVVWHKQPESLPSGYSTAIWYLEALGSNTLLNTALGGFGLKFASVYESSYTNGHRIKLLNAKEDDKGLYFCLLHSITIVISPKRQLVVQGEWFSQLLVVLFSWFY